MKYYICFREEISEIYREDYLEESTGNLEQYDIIFVTNNLPEFKNIDGFFPDLKNINSQLKVVYRPVTERDIDKTRNEFIRKREIIETLDSVLIDTKSYKDNSLESVFYPAYKSGIISKNELYAMSNRNIYGFNSEDIDTLENKSIDNIVEDPIFQYNIYNLEVIDDGPGYIPDELIPEEME